MGIMASLARVVWRGVSEKKDFGLSDPAAFAAFGLVPAASGVVVTAQSAMRVPSVRRAVSLISEAVATLPFKIYNEDKQTAKDHTA